MRIAASIVGLLWIITVVAAGVVLMASGSLRGGRGVMFLLFLAALPGIFLLRWGRRAPDRARKQ
jgi:hypothetical protein